MAGNFPGRGEIFLGVPQLYLSIPDVSSRIFWCLTKNKTSCIFSHIYFDPRGTRGANIYLEFFLNMTGYALTKGNLNFYLNLQVYISAMNISS